jgi:hypothetical protein
MHLLRVASVLSDVNRVLQRIEQVPRPSIRREAQRILRLRCGLWKTSISTKYRRGW